jgi:hypothetical protein
MTSSGSGSSQLAQLNHPILTDVVFRNASQSSTGLSYNGRTLTRGTLGFIEYAKLRGFLPSSSPQNDKLDLAEKNLSPLEKVVKAVQLQLIGHLDSHVRAQLFQTATSFHELKEASLKGRNDLISKLIQHVKGDLRTLKPQDIAVLQEIGSSITSLNLSRIALTPQMLEEIVRLFPRLQELDFSYIRITDACISKLEPLKPYLTALHITKSDAAITSNGLKVISKFSLLKKLNIEAFLFTDAGIRFLGNLPKLEYLSLTTTLALLKRATMQELGEKLKSLQALHLIGFIYESGFINESVALLNLSLFTNLRELIIDPKEVEISVPDPVFAEIGKLTKLRALKIQATRDIRIAITTDKALEYLSNLTQLEKLDIWPPFHTDKEKLENCLKSFSHLTDLQITHCVFDAPDFMNFYTDAEKLFEVVANSCKALKRLCFSKYYSPHTQKFQQLTTLPELEQIEFRDARHLPRTIFENLDKFPKLKKLVISNCRKITLADVENARASQKKMPIIEFTASLEDPADSESDDSDDDN